MKYVFIPRPYDNQETMHEEGSGGLHSGGSLKHRRTHKINELVSGNTTSQINENYKVIYNYIHANI